MKRRLKFIKETDGWFVDLPEWKGSREDLQMVCGSDTFLEILCEGNWDVWISLDTTKTEEWDCLEMIEVEDFGSGQWYNLKSYRGIEFDLDMWLCDVTKFIFGKFPEKIYFSYSGNSRI